MIQRDPNTFAGLTMNAKVCRHAEKAEFFSLLFLMLFTRLFIINTG